MTTTTNPAGSSNKLFTLLIVAVVVIGLGAVALLATSRDSAIDEDIEPTAAIDIGGDGLTAMPQGVGLTDASTDPSAGQVAPSLTGTTFQGEEATIEADGRPKAIYFLAHWCPHCQDEVPVVQGLIDTDQVPEGVDIYAVSTAVDAGRGNFPPYLWLDREDFTPTTIRDDAESSAYTAYGAGGFPYVVYLDGENKVIGRSSGELATDSIVGMWEALAATQDAAEVE